MISKAAKRVGVMHEYTSSGTPRYNGGADASPGLLKEKAPTTLEGMVTGSNENLRAEATSVTYDLGDVCITIASKDGILLFGEWCSTQAYLERQ